MGSNGNIHPQRLHRFLTIMPCTIRNQAGMRGLIAAGSFNGGFLSGVGDFLKKIGVFSFSLLKMIPDQKRGNWWVYFTLFKPSFLANARHKDFLTLPTFGVVSRLHFRGISYESTVNVVYGLAWHDLQQTSLFRLDVYHCCHPYMTGRLKGGLSGAADTKDLGFFSLEATG